MNGLEVGRHAADVSRETLDRLNRFYDLLKRWNPTINLVSKASLLDGWDRHILDSLEVFSHAPKGLKWVDLGSGGGFPGLVVAIVAAEKAPDLRVTLVESDQRKAVFLRTAARETGVEVDVFAARIEKLEPQNADILSARALTDLSGLLQFVERHLRPGGTALFPKGVHWKSEVQAARKHWQFDHEAIKSLTEQGSVILKIQGVSRV